MKYEANQRENGKWAVYSGAIQLTDFDFGSKKETEDFIAYLEDKEKWAEECKRILKMIMEFTEQQKAEREKAIAELQEVMEQARKEWDAQLQKILADDDSGLTPGM